MPPMLDGMVAFSAPPIPSAGFAGTVVLRLFCRSPGFVWLPPTGAWISPTPGVVMGSWSSWGAALMALPMTTPGVGEIQAPVGGNQTNPGDLQNNLNTTVPANPAEGMGGAENATMPSNIGGMPNQLGTRLANRINSRNNKH
uniref:Uncharacterized protein n=1 Tax=Anopheles melas TaxID=34690 RepID=A0A182TL38_9DIPT